MVGGGSCGGGDAHRRGLLRGLDVTEDTGETAFPAMEVEVRVPVPADDGSAMATGDMVGALGAGGVKTSIGGRTLLRGAREADL